MVIQQNPGVASWGVKERIREGLGEVGWACGVGSRAMKQARIEAEKYMMRTWLEFWFWVLLDT